MSTFLNIHTHTSSFVKGAIRSLDVSEAGPWLSGQWYSVGLHPWKIQERSDEQLEKLKLAAALPQVKLIGECGLDKTISVPLSLQVSLFEAQIRMAELLSKPVIIHCVRAFEELIALKKRLNPSVPLIIHGFRKKPVLARQLTAQGFYLSFGATLMHSPSLADTFKNHTGPFFLETDDDPILISTLYERAAELKKISVEQLKDIIFAHWKSLRLPDFP